MQETPQEREARMRDLAQRLLFKVEKANGRFTLMTRPAPKPRWRLGVREICAREGTD
jgi:hypothetical protein